MKNMNQYISDLLYRYECVLIPEFGAILTRNISATIDSGSNLFLAPRKELSFNEQLQQNDGLLANHISLAEKISYAEATKYIEEFVTNTKAKLVEGEIVSLEKIGHFSFTADGKIQFIPNTEVNYLTSSFGLQATHKQAVLREVYKEEIEQLEEKAPIAFIPETRKRKRPYLRYAAITVLGLGLLGFMGKSYVDQQLTEVANHNYNEKEFKSTRISYQTAGFFIDNPIETPEVVIEAKVVKPVTGPYHIIAGAFRFEENADKKMAQLEEQGYTPRKIGQNKYGLHQVVYGSFEDRLEALENLREVKRNHNRKAWLLVKDFN